MELILKQPANKPPFLGVMFSGEYEGSQINKSLIDNYRDIFYKIALEPIGDKINITITGDGIGFAYTYTAVKFNPEKLTHFFNNTRKETRFNFGHLIVKENDYKVIRTIGNQSLMVFRINELKLVLER